MSIDKDVVEKNRLCTTHQYGNKDILWQISQISQHMSKLELTTFTSTVANVIDES